jgi:CRISPR/Cas system-associated exonuclease Cas4 (RecB family)
LLRERPELWKPQNLDEYRTRKRDASLEGWPVWTKAGGKRLPIYAANQANHCARKLWYQFMGMTPEPMDVDGCLRVYDGEPHGDSLVHWLTEMGYKVYDREKKFKKLALNTPVGNIGVVGHIDGMIDGPEGVREKGTLPYVLEMKGLSCFTWTKPPEEVVNKDYRWQAQVYMWLTGITRTMFVIKNKNNSQFKFFELTFDKRIIAKLKHKWVAILKAVKAKKPMPRDYAEDSLQCSWCGFKKTCWRR